VVGHEGVMGKQIPVECSSLPKVVVMFSKKKRFGHLYILYRTYFIFNGVEKIV
jgi:hypothetical protein